ncbi:hypothetical protein [Nocardia seriolae]|uniref:hypothetical protein n=1 Tax=Nocardia seriolae TaxID=37332 RepID=UPI0008FF1F9B|nr:hypothetical protein [Nocardia seriolae]OJF77859.1 hypothetical protein NS14008_38280 [Nocardia seriolae]PSK27102.1 hypothetical protein C6575_33750 [Nocardia seriolae]QOW30780.1 hypothetical protein IMZ23_21675 [Nocardia seriolae]QUN15293.1 hypothetical protein KEC46_23235 [Nocardia seriolae]
MSSALPAFVAMTLASAGCADLATNGAPQRSTPASYGMPSASQRVTAPPTTTPFRVWQTTTPVLPATTTAAPASTTAAPTSQDPAAAEPTDVAVCVDLVTSLRVEDDLCDDDADEVDDSDTGAVGHTYANFWYAHSPSLVYPAVGAAVVYTLGSFVRPVGERVYDRGVPHNGGRILRGGLGLGRHGGGHGHGHGG